MKISFAPSFAKSLRKLRRDSMWHMKIWNFFRYDLYNYFKNLKTFHKSLWRFRSWNGDGILMFMEASLKKTGDCIEQYGNEIDESRLKKVEKIRRACEILKNINEDRYMDMAEAKFGELKGDLVFGEPDENNLSKIDMYQTQEDAIHDGKVFDYVRELEEKEWAELWEILKGQRDLVHTFDNDEEYYKQFDGSGLKGWWD